MNAFRHISGLENADFGERRLALAIGMFDGAHIGHQQVFKSAIRDSEKRDGIAGALVFWPHPSRLFHPEDPTLMVSTPTMKRLEMQRSGLSFVIEEAFDRELASVEAKRFIDFLKERLPTLASVHVGENWRFGKGREGDAALLSSICEEGGIEAHIEHSVEIGADRVSSTRIREALRNGRIEDANQMLGRSYEVSGVVQKGRRLGRTIDVPTLNIPFEPELAPKFGVYAGAISGVAGTELDLPTIFNFGVRPTVETEDAAPLLEAHVLASDCPLSYGDEVRVVFKSFIRPELKFDGVESLKAQIVRDIGEARNRLKVTVDGEED